MEPDKDLCTKIIPLQKSRCQRLKSLSTEINIKLNSPKELGNDAPADPMSVLLVPYLQTLQRLGNTSESDANPSESLHSNKEEKNSSIVSSSQEDKGRSVEWR
jgi:hypothetical protein